MREAIWIELLDIGVVMCKKGHGGDDIDVGMSSFNPVFEIHGVVEIEVTRGNLEERVFDTLEAEPQGAGLLTVRAGVKTFDVVEYTYSGRYAITWAGSGTNIGD